MSNTLKRLMLAALAASLCISAAAQVPPTQSPNDQADNWVVVSPAGAGFGVLMSKHPAAAEQLVQTEGLSVSGLRYADAAADVQAASFTVWALRDSRGIGQRLLAADNAAEGVSGESLYLDRIAELSWELLVTPELERLKREGDTGQRAVEADLGMTYQRQFELSNHPAREYSVRLEKERGLIYVCADGARIYIVAGLSADATDPRLKLFADSFTLGGTPRLPEVAKSTLPTPATIQADPPLIRADPRDIPYGLPNSTAPSSGPGRGGGMGTGAGTGIGGGGGDPGGGGPGSGAVDYTRPFKHSEVTRKALITFKPEPGFTEWARRFNVTGVVRLRAILHSSGTVQNISVVKTLPHGLTRTALGAAKQIRFEPAQKDGRAVSQYVVLEYNYNIY